MASEHILTFFGFPFPVLALWRFDDLSLVYTDHSAAPLGDNDLAGFVKRAFEIGPIRAAATFSGPGPFTTVRTGLALLDGLSVGAPEMATYRPGCFEVLFDKDKDDPLNKEVWAIDNGRQGWWLGCMAPRKMTGDSVLTVEENISHVQVEALKKERTVNTLWFHTSVDLLFSRLMKDLAVYVEKEERAIMEEDLSNDSPAAVLGA